MALPLAYPVVVSDDAPCLKGLTLLNLVGRDPTKQY